MAFEKTQEKSLRTERKPEKYCINLFKKGNEIG